MNDVRVQTEGIASALSSFRAKVAELQATFEEINTETNAIKGSWEGVSSDSLTAAVQAFQSVYDAVEAKTTTYMNFLDTVISTYTKEDSDIGSSADSLSD